jgi:hypothetical protein
MELSVGITLPVTLLASKGLGNYVRWCWRKMAKVSWTDRLRNEMLQRVNEVGVKYPANNKKKEG